jgi:hypothetical protein
VDFILEGELTLVPENILRPYVWTTIDGIEASVSGSHVFVEWPDVTIPEEPAWERMKLEIESRLLIETLESGAPHAVRWTRYGTANPTGIRVSETFSIGTWVARRPFVPLSNHDAAVGLVGLGPDQRGALELYREAMDLADQHWEAALTRAFVAVELLIEDLIGNSSRGAWKQAGQMVRYLRRNAPQLYFSFQHARHAYATEARANLRKLSRRPLSFAECLEQSGRFIEKLLDYRRRHRQT